MRYVANGQYILESNNDGDTVAVTHGERAFERAQLIAYLLTEHDRMRLNAKKLLDALAEPELHLYVDTGLVACGAVSTDRALPCTTDIDAVNCEDCLRKK